MQLQRFFTLASLALLGNVVSTLADLEADKVPQQCRQICQSIVQRSQECDRNTHDDHAEKECMCKLNNASTVIPQCEACMAKYHNEVSDHSDPHDNDVMDIIQFCQFSTTTYNGGSMPATSTGSGASTTGSLGSSLGSTFSSGRASGSASASGSEYTGGANAMNAGGNTLGIFGIIGAAALV